VVAFGTAVSVAQQYAGDVSAKYDALASEYAKFASCKYKSIARGDTKCTAGRCDFVGGVEVGSLDGNDTPVCLPDPSVLSAR
jgi:hypothetical protein